MLTLVTVPWARQKMSTVATLERSLVLMVASRTILLGLAMLVLALTGRRAALAWVLLADAALQLFDAGAAVAQRKRKLAAMPLVLCLLDGWAGLTLM